MRSDLTQPPPPSSPIGVYGGLGLSQNAVIEMAVRKLAYTEGFLDSDSEEARHYRETREKRRDQRRSRHKEQPPE